jgi:hypothetical protein
MLLLWTILFTSARNVPRWVMAIMSAILVIIAFFYSFTRDANSYFVLLLALLMLTGLLSRFIRRHSRAHFYLFVIAGFVAIYLAQNSSVINGRRWQTPLRHVIVERVLRDSDALSFFLRRGLPAIPEFLKLQRLSYADYTLAFQTDPVLDPVKDWIDQRGRLTYALYLLSRIDASLRQPIQEYNSLINADSSEYRKIVNSERPWMADLSNIFYPRPVGIALFLFVVCLGAGMVYTWRVPRRPAWFVTLALLLTVYPLMFVVWHGDTIEEERHAVQIGIQIRLAFWMMAIYLVDVLNHRYVNSKS